VAGYKLRAASDPQKNPFTPFMDAATWEVTQLATALGLEPRQATD
jgi:phage terminase small subunit